MDRTTYPLSAAAAYAGGIMRVVSVKVMLEQIAAMLGTDDLTEWETSFVEGVQRNASDTTRLSGKQVEVIERIWRKHFA